MAAARSSAVTHAEPEHGDQHCGAGHVSSLFAVQIVMWVERTFDLPVTGDDLDIRNFHSIERIARFVTDRLALDIP